MRYVIIDLRGNQRGSWDSADELAAELVKSVTVDPVSLRSLYVISYDRPKHESGPAVRGDKFLAAQGLATTLDNTRPATDEEFEENFGDLPFGPA